MGDQQEPKRRKMATSSVEMNETTVENPCTMDETQGHEPLNQNGSVPVATSENSTLPEVDKSVCVLQCATEHTESERRLPEAATESSPCLSTTNSTEKITDQEKKLLEAREELQKTKRTLQNDLTELQEERDKKASEINALDLKIKKIQSKMESSDIKLQRILELLEELEVFTAEKDAEVEGLSAEDSYSNLEYLVKKYDEFIQKKARKRASVVGKLREDAKQAQCTCKTVHKKENIVELCSQNAKAENAAERSENRLEIEGTVPSCLGDHLKKRANLLTGVEKALEQSDSESRIDQLAVLEDTNAALKSELEKTRNLLSGAEKENNACGTIFDELIRMIEKFTDNCKTWGNPPFYDQVAVRGFSKSVKIVLEDVRRFSSADNGYVSGQLGRLERLTNTVSRLEQQVVFAC